jgi:hypothetical protein
MKIHLLLVFLLLSGNVAFGQSGLELKGYFGVSGTLVGPNADVAGGSSVEMEGFREFGLTLSKGIGGKFRLNGGLSYAYSNVEGGNNYCALCSEPGFPNPNLPYAYNQDFRILSIPVYAEYELTNFLYVAAGPLLDFQLSEDNNFDDQSGLGYLVGLGGKVRARKFTFSAFPNYKRHAVIPFDKPQGYKDFLQEFGLQFGVGYRL